MNQIQISNYSVIPYVGKEKGLVAWLNFTLALDGKNFIELHSVSVWKLRDDDPRGPYDLRFPAKPISGGYNFFFKILSAELIKDLKTIVASELSTSGQIDFALDHLL